MIEETDLALAVECPNCDGTGEHPYDEWLDWERCDCGDDDCNDCNGDIDMDDEPDYCEACGGSGQRDNPKKCLNEYLTEWDGYLNSEEKQLVRDFLLSQVNEGILTSLDICEIIDNHVLSD